MHKRPKRLPIKEERAERAERADIDSISLMNSFNYRDFNFLPATFDVEYHIDFLTPLIYY